MKPIRRPRLNTIRAYAIINKEKKGSINRTLNNRYQIFYSKKEAQETAKRLFCVHQMWKDVWTKNPFEVVTIEINYQEEK